MFNLVVTYPSLDRMIGVRDGGEIKYLHFSRMSNNDEIDLAITLIGDPDYGKIGMSIDLKTIDLHTSYVDSLKIDYGNDLSVVTISDDPSDIERGLGLIARLLSEANS